MSDTVFQAGEYNLDYAEILQAGGSAVDIRNQIDGISFYEDIYSPFISGKITMRDTQDLPNWLGRSGRDLLHISVGTPSLDEKTKIQGYFLIYKMSDRTMIRDRTQMYNFYFMSIESLNDLHTQISKSFSGTSDKIVKTLAASYLKTDKLVDVEESTHSFKFISNFWSPSKCLNFAAMHAKNAKDDASFLFFENRQGFNFKTISNLAKQDIIQSFDEIDFSVDITTDSQNKIQFGQANRDPNKDFTVPQEVRMYTTYDYIDAYRGGAIKTSMSTFDLLTKKYSVSDFSASKGALLNKNALFRDDVIDAAGNMRMFLQKSYGTLDIPNSTNSQYLQSRISLLKLFSSSKLEIDVFGRTDYTIGKKVYYNSDIKTQISNDDLPKDLQNNVISGYYIITAISHNFNRNSHMCTIELSKESTKLS